MIGASRLAKIRRGLKANQKLRNVLQSPKNVVLHTFSTRRQLDRNGVLDETRTAGRCVQSSGVHVWLSVQRAKFILKLNCSHFFIWQNISVLQKDQTFKIKQRVEANSFFVSHLAIKIIYQFWLVCKLCSLLWVVSLLIK